MDRQMDRKQTNKWKGGERERQMAEVKEQIVMLWKCTIFWPFYKFWNCLHRIFQLCEAKIIQYLGLGTGTGKLVVIRSWVSWVWCWVLVHCDILCTCTTVSQVFHRYITARWTSFLLFFSSFLVFLVSNFNLSHCDTAKYGHASCTYILIFLLSSSHTHAE